MTEVKRLDLGAVSAYALAVEKGYKGTEEEFVEILTNALNYATQAQESASAAAGSAEDAGNYKTQAGEILASVNLAGAQQIEAIESAGTQQTNAAKEAIEAKGKETLDSIPDSYEALQGDVTQLRGEIGYLNDGCKKPMHAMVSFIDDDCRSETYTILFPIIQETGIQYTLACPPGSIGDIDGKYVTEEHLMEMYNAGINISCHHSKQYNMDQFVTEDDYEAELNACDAMFRKLGISGVNSVSYPQGVYVDDYIRTVKKHYKMGFTVSRGINQIPYESYFMKRCEVFPTNGAYTLDDAKACVDQVSTYGGWLIFMTHAWYPTFDSEGLKELIAYIREKGVDIVDVNTAIKTTGNIIEVGKFKKPLEEVSKSFFVVDCNGEVWANALNLINRSTEEITVINAQYYTGCYLKPAGGKADHADTNRTVSVDVAVSPGEVYRLTCSAVYGGLAYGVYSVGDDMLTLITDAGENGYYAVENDADGEVLTDKEIVIPENAAYLRVSANLNYQPDGFVIKKVVTF